MLSDTVSVVAHFLLCPVGHKITLCLKHEGLNCVVVNVQLLRPAASPSASFLLALLEETLGNCGQSPSHSPCREPMSRGNRARSANGGAAAGTLGSNRGSERRVLTGYSHFSPVTSSV